MLARMYERVRARTRTCRKETEEHRGRERGACAGKGGASAHVQACVRQGGASAHVQQEHTQASPKAQAMDLARNRARVKGAGMQ